MDPQQRMMSMISGYWVTQIVRTVAELGIADHLADGPRTSAELADASGCQPEAMSRFLRACASQQLVVFRPDGTFETTPALAMLREGVSHSLRDIAIVHGSPGHWLPWGRLPDAVRTGEPQTTATLGVDIWGHFAANPVEFGRFINSMTELTAGLSDQIAELLDVTGVGVTVDVGGANGALLHAVLQSSADMRGVLLDLPDVTATATAEAEKAGLADRVTVVGGSFFDPIPAGDLLLLKAVLHNWDDDACVRILTNCRAALNPGGRLVVVEMLLSPMGEPGFTPLHDLNMLTVVSGRERDLDRYDSLFAAAGLRRTGVTPTHSPQCLIEAVTA